MRADRLVAVLLLLQARGRVTAAELAVELEVSVRTARRDLEALAASGVPIYSSRGRGGGWTLLGGAKTNLTGLTKGEAQALVLATTIGGAGIEAVGPELRAATAKLIQAMPKTFRAEAAAAGRALHVDPNRWSGPAQRIEEPESLEPLRRAVTTGRQVELGYTSPAGVQTLRTVHPYGLVTKASVWYLVAGTDRGRRTFRLSRVTSVDIVDDPAERPADFDLGKAWDSIKADFGSHLAKGDIVARAIVHRWALGPLRSVPASRVLTVESLDDQRIRVEVSAQSLMVLTYAFAGLGPTAQVEGPAELTAALADRGACLVEQYGSHD